MNEQQARDLHTAAVALAMKVRTEYNDEDGNGVDQDEANDLASFVLALCEQNKEHVVRLTPFPHANAVVQLPCELTETGPFTSRAEAERTLRGAMTTGRFASGTIVTRERGAS